MRLPRSPFAIAIIGALGLCIACSQENSTAPETLPPGTLSLTNSTVTVSAASLTADGASTATITVQARDQADAPITHSIGTVEITASAGIVGGLSDHGDGTYTATLMAPTHVTTATISAMLDGLYFAHTAAVNFVAGPPDLSVSSLEIQDTVMLADGAATTTVILSLYDAHGNQVTLAADKVVFATTNGSISAATLLSGGYIATLTAAASVSSGSVSATVNGQPAAAARSVRFALHQLWVRRAPVGCCIDDMSSGVVNGVFYVTGGWNGDTWDEGGTSSAATTAYDPGTNTWTARAPMSGPRYLHGTGVINGVLYVVGGWDDNGLLSSLEAYDPAANTWTSKAPMLTARGDLAVGVVGGVLYAVGGSNGEPLATVEAYDPVTNSWTTKASLPLAREGLAVGVVNGILYALGGYQAPSNAVYAYDPLTDSWTAKAHMPTGRGGLAAGAFGSKLYALGGSSSNAFELYDPATNSWAAGVSLPVNASGIGAAVVNGDLFVIGMAEGASGFEFIP